MRERSKVMIPNIYIHEQLMLERCQEMQRATAQQRLAVGLRQERGRRPPRFVANIAGCLLKLGSSLKQLGTGERQVTYDH
jgi:hypothetical protein